MTSPESETPATAPTAHIPFDELITELNEPEEPWVDETEPVDPAVRKKKIRKTAILSLALIVGLGAIPLTSLAVNAVQDSMATSNADGNISDARSDADLGAAKKEAKAFDADLEGVADGIAAVVSSDTNADLVSARTLLTSAVQETDIDAIIDARADVVTTLAAVAEYTANRATASITDEPLASEKTHKAVAKAVSALRIAVKAESKVPAALTQVAKARAAQTKSHADGVAAAAKAAEEAAAAQKAADEAAAKAQKLADEKAAADARAQLIAETQAAAKVISDQAQAEAVAKAIAETQAAADAKALALLNAAKPAPAPTPTPAPTPR